MLGLAAKHGPARLERACARAIEVGDPSYRTIKGILAARTEAGPAPEPTGDGGAAAHLHGPSQLFANVVALPRPSSQPSTDTASGDHPGHDHSERPAAPTPVQLEHTNDTALDHKPTPNSEEAS